ncbi:MAG: endo alpha-1,4 polygalactosaminidase [Saccharofermentans sp.]|nr:endo alpha-1,4 polygalactosaminidase [Saccharofermentans sp.]
MLFVLIWSNTGDTHDYGVFLGASPEDIEYMTGYDTIVIDAQYYTAEEIAELKDGGRTVLSYINIGSLEDFRPYYDEYEHLTFADYENWDEERWVDVSSRQWQDFILKELAPSILDKGIDGLFVDNVDVYYIASEEGLYPGNAEDIFIGVENILTGLQALDTYVSINGGNTFVMEYLDRGVGHDLTNIMDAVNQETVFSSIDFEEESFGRQNKEDHEYYLEYIETCADEGIDVYLLEYTTDRSVIADIRDYCTGNGFTYYASSTIELLAVTSA